MKSKLSLITAAFAVALLLNAFGAVAQDAPPPPPPPPGQGDNQGPGGGRRGNMQDFMQRMNERVKTALKATDEEWAVIQPLLEKVQTIQRETMSSRFGGFGRRSGGPGSPGGNQGDQGQRGPGGQGGGSPESQALRTALESDSTSADEIKTKLAALREARKKSQAQLEQAREELKKVLTLRQEATLVQMGLLD